MRETRDTVRAPIVVLFMNDNGEKGPRHHVTHGYKGYCKYGYYRHGYRNYGYRDREDKGKTDAVLKALD